MPAFTRVRLVDNGWEGEIHPADARVLVASGAAVDLDAEAGKPVVKLRPRATKPKAKPIEPPPVDELPLDA